MSSVWARHGRRTHGRRLRPKRPRRARTAIGVAAVLAVGALVASMAPSTAATPQSAHRPIDAWALAAATGVTIKDVRLSVPYGPPMPTYIVEPQGARAPRSMAGILFLHWLGDVHSDRTEYLAEAVALASKGVVSVLPQGVFPWADAPDGTSDDLQRIDRQVSDFGTALDRLAANAAVDPTRIALVGHDYGAMFGALLSDEDPRISTAVFETPDARWGNWFATYWLGLQGAERAAYVRLFTTRDPVRHTARLGGHVLFQWAGKDVYVTPKVVADYARHDPDAQVLSYPNASHQLDDQAAADRDAFLAAQLGLAG